LHFWLIFCLKLFVAINIGIFLNKKSQLKKAGPICPYTYRKKTNLKKGLRGLILA